MLHQLVSRALGMTVALAVCTGALASPYDAIYAFGDSLSDVGNYFITTGDTSPPPPYYNGQYSNGNVWLQTLASDLGLSALTPSLLGGTDYAYGGAQTGTTAYNTAGSTDLYGSTGQIAQFQAAHATADPNALYTILIGANDLRNLPSSATTAQDQQLIGQAVVNIDLSIDALAAEGAKNFLVLTVPDLGKTPSALAGGPAASASASALTAAFNSALLGSLVAGTGTHISVFDTYAFVDQIVASPATYGFTDVTDACLNALTLTECANPNQYLFWDAIHPTAVGHALLGNDVAAALLAAPVPLPAPALLLMSGLFGLALLMRRAHPRQGLKS